MINERVMKMNIDTVDRKGNRVIIISYNADEENFPFVGVRINQKANLTYERYNHNGLCAMKIEKETINYESFDMHIYYSTTGSSSQYDYDLVHKLPITEEMQIFKYEWQYTHKIFEIDISEYTGIYDDKGHMAVFDIFAVEDNVVCRIDGGYKYFAKGFFIRDCENDEEPWKYCSYTKRVPVALLGNRVKCNKSYFKNLFNIE